ncbi:MAG TPA: hypothetical protein VGE00_02920 [Gammaproteobacteria bacterium]
MGKKLWLIGALASALALAGCNGDDDNNNTAPATPTDKSSQETFEQNSVILDKAYVPALFYSNMTSASEGLATDAATTLALTDSHWQHFKTTHRYRYSYTIWEKRFALIDANITTAADFYAALNNYPADLTIAHNELEAVRDTLGAMRSDAQVNWFMDSVTKAHHAMEPVAGAAKAYSDGLTTLVELKAALNLSLPIFRTEWDALVAAYGDGAAVQALYGLSEAKGSALTLNISNTDPLAPGMTQILAKLATALESGDDATLTTLAGKVKPKFVTVFLAFGDFITPFGVEVIAANQAFIPALYCTNNPPDAATVCADSNGDTLQGTLDYLNAFAAAVQAFGAHYPVSDTMNLPGALGWGAKMGEIQLNLQAAIGVVQDAITNGGTLADVAAAHESLEAVRSAFYYICTTYEGHNTMMSRLSEYHLAFEAILLDYVMISGTSTAKTMLSPSDIDGIKAAMAGLQAAFDNMKGAADSLDKSAWGMEAVELSPLLDAQQANIDALQVALDAADNDAIIARAIDLKKKYTPFFVAFGSF